MRERGFNEVAGATHVDQEVLTGGVEAEDFEVAVWEDDFVEAGLTPHSERLIVDGEDGLDLVLPETIFVI